MSSAPEVASESRPAPGALGFVQQFINSRDGDSVDELATVEGYRDWLRRAGLAATAVTEQDRERAVAVREALRRLALHNNGAALYPVDLAVLNQAAADVHVRFRFGPRGSRLEADGAGPEAALAAILGAVHEAMEEGTWSRFKACRDATCQWAFYDHSKNRAGTWCSMASCGNRTKARAYRQRRRGER